MSNSEFPRALGDTPQQAILGKLLVVWCQENDMPQRNAEELRTIDYKAFRGNGAKSLDDYLKRIKWLDAFIILFNHEA